MGTFAWNTARHLALYWAAPCTGRVLHTLNIRLFPEQLSYVVNHAEDEVIFVDRSLLALLWPLVPTFETVKQIVVMDDGADTEIPDDPRIVDYAELVAAADPVAFHVEDEDQAAAMCYTSGTTGNPKGVLYSHRSNYLHALCGMTSAATATSERDTVLPVVPLFHANAWGFAQTPIFAGANIVLPGPDLSPAAIVTLLEQERVTITAGVPTIWRGMLPLLDDHDLSSLRLVIGGGSAVPKALSEAYREKLGFPLAHAWGMTETSPVASFNHVRSADLDRPEEELAEIRAPGRARRSSAWTAGSSSPGALTSCRGTTWPPASCRSGARGSPVPTTATTAPTIRSHRTAGCAPVTWPRSTSTATSGWSTAPRTWSSPAANGSARSSWRTS